MRSLRSTVSLGAMRTLVCDPRLWSHIPRFLLQLARYRQLERGHGIEKPLRLYPCLKDATTSQVVSGVYFYQDCWAARQIFKERPPYFVDIGSTTLLVGILSQFARGVSIDFRPMDSQLEGLEVVKGSATALPFADGEVPCISSMCVLEHIGLGRYGDPLDPLGTRRAVSEISRVLKSGGVVIFSVPVARHSLIEFNANRRFALAEAESFFPEWTVVDRVILDPNPKPYSEETVECSRDLVACYCLRKP